jgi:hypothetical protein
MRLVIDKNSFETEELREFLAKDTANQAVLPSSATVESYAGDPAKNLPKSTSILLQFPDQVFILKDPYELMCMGAIDASQPMSLIDEAQTRQFRDTPRFLRELEQRQPEALKYLEQQGRTAEEIREETAEWVQKYLLPLLDVPFKFPNAMAERRKCLAISKDGPAINEAIWTLGAAMHSNIPGVPPFHMTARVTRHHYRARQAIAMWALAFRWALDRGPSGVNLKRLRNDFVDLSYVVPATYFDGLMTNDAKTMDIYNESAFIVGWWGC